MSIDLTLSSTTSIIVTSGLLLLAGFMRVTLSRADTQQKLHTEYLQTLKSGSESPLESDSTQGEGVEEWHDVGDDTQIASVVFYPTNPRPIPYTLLLVIPGNPGIPAFYAPLLRTLFLRLHGQVEARCISYAGHYLPSKNGDRVFDLADHIDHQRAYLQTRIQADPSLRVILIGHSIGSYLSLQLVLAFPDHIEKLVLMQPTIHHIANSDQGRNMRWLLRHPRFAHNCSHAAEAVLPTFVRRWLVRRAIGSQQEHAYEVAALLLVHGFSIHNVVHTASQEMTTVLDVDEEMLHAHEHHTLFVYSPVDGWVPSRNAQLFQLLFSQAKHRILPHAHAFMMERDGVRDMADHIMAFVDDMTATNSNKNPTVSTN